MHLLKPSIPAVKRTLETTINFTVIFTERQKIKQSDCRVHCIVDITTNFKMSAKNERLLRIENNASSKCRHTHPAALKSIHTNYNIVAS